MKIYQVDAFTENIFGGNPAAVCPLDDWLSDELLQQIAAENNLAETAFYVQKENEFQIRWFTPTVEVDLCGHATLAAAFVLFHFENYSEKIVFNSPRSGLLEVKQVGDLLSMNFPADEIEQCDLTDEFMHCFNVKPQKVFKGKTDYLLIFSNEAEVKSLRPNIPQIEKLKARGVIVTSKGVSVDFVSRFFAPQSGIPEDPVTGSAHTTLTPYWSKLLGKNEMTAAQLSSRGGYLQCVMHAGRVEMLGKAKLYMIGEIFIK